MSLIVSFTAAIIAAGSLVSPECAHFPGSYFNSHGKITLQQRAMEKWPGPSQLVRRWRAGELDQREQMAVLLGASASHDPVLLPLYREAVVADSPRLRMAAAFGYRELLGDAVPNVGGGLDLDAAHGLAAEMDAVATTLRVRPLVELWLQSALATEGKAMPGWQGTYLNRPAGICFRAVEQVLTFDDIRYVMTAYRLAEEIGNRAALLRLLEAVSLQRFYVRPSGARAGWGRDDLVEALKAADDFVEYWMDVRCVNDSESVLGAAFLEMGARTAHPLEPESYFSWLQLLRQGSPTWRLLVARQLYLFGGAWPRLSVFQADSARDIEAWESLLGWYGVLPSRAPGSGRQQLPGPS